MCFRPVIFSTVVGEKEKTNATANVRTRDNKVHGEKSVENIIARFKELQQSKANTSEEPF